MRVDSEVMQALEAFVPLAPLHQPHNLGAIRAVAQHAPRFRKLLASTPPSIVRNRLWRSHSRCRANTPKKESSVTVFMGCRTNTLPRCCRASISAAAGRTVVAHLGNGASMCAMNGGLSVATTMSFSAVDGLPMGTRSGSLDPGVLLYLMDKHGMNARAIESLIYKKSGLLGVSGISSDMRALLESKDPHAAEAVDLFVYRISRELGSLAAALGGLDALVFTGGIGENAAEVRARVCRAANWLGLELDEAANHRSSSRISSAASRVAAWVIPTNEELLIAKRTRSVLAERKK